MRAKKSMKKEKLYQKNIRHFSAKLMHIVYFL